MRLARVEQVVWGFILAPMGEESQVQRDKGTLRIAVTPGGCGEKPPNCPVGCCRIFWELHRGGNFADSLSKTFSCPSRKQWGRTSNFFWRFDGGLFRKVVCQKAQLKCLSTNARSMGNKQEELEAMMCLENNGLVAIRETWWDQSHNWRTVIQGYRLFRRDIQGVFVCVRACVCVHCPLR